MTRDGADGRDPTDARGTPARQRRVGAVVVVLLTVAVVGLQLWRSGQQRNRALDLAFAELAAAADGPVAARKERLVAAEATFARAAGTLSIDPVAVVALGLMEGLALHLGQPPPPAPPSADRGLDLARGHAIALLHRGHSQAAITWLARPENRRHQHDLTALRQFAQAWQLARQRRLQ